MVEADSTVLFPDPSPIGRLSPDREISPDQEIS